MPQLIRISNKKISLAGFALFFLFCASFFIKESQADSPRTIPPRPCDFYGIEQSVGTIRTGSIIIAKDPNGIVIGQFTITNNGRYGFLTCRPDDPNTLEDEGAVDGDIISFYIDGAKQQKQAIWKSKEAIQVDLGIPTVDGAFNLHLVDMPGYTNYQGNPNYSGVAVADMIIDYLVPGNSDTQQSLMSYADLNADGKTSASELERLLNRKVGGGYNFGSTATINRYSARGILDQFDATNQNDCIKQICHWLAYKVPNVALVREYVPVAISTSAEPATNADSDYSHWMSLVGIKTNQDPFPNLSDTASFREEYRVPQSLQLYGVYLNDPGQSGLGFHTYMAADVWTTQYFRPIAAGLEGQGAYAAIMEPPDPKAIPVKINNAENNSRLQAVLEIPEKGISIFIPNTIDKRIKNYLLSLLRQLKQSPDFATLTNDVYFGKALKNTEVRRCFKVDARVNPDYTIIPFEKNVRGKLITPLVVIANNETGQFQMASADNKASNIFSPMPWYEAYKALRKQIGWGEYPVEYWLSNSAGQPLFPGWSVVTAKYSQQGPVGILSTNEYTITAQGKVNLESSSPGVKILSSRMIGTGKEWIKLISFKITGAQKYTVTADKKHRYGKSYIWKNGQDTWLVMLKGPQPANCKIEIKSAYSTYIYMRK